jgi:hypothetical protein
MRSRLFWSSGAPCVACAGEVGDKTVRRTAITIRVCKRIAKADFFIAHNLLKNFLENPDFHPSTSKANVLGTPQLEIFRI